VPDTLALWHAEHVNFDRLLNLLDDQLSLFHDGGSPDYALMLDIMFYMTHYSDVLHHPKEDLVFAKIKERDSTMARIVDDLHRQHARIHAAGAELVHQLDDIVNGSIASRAAIEAAARDYVDGLRKHMRVEESDVLPHAATLLNSRDWSAIHAAIGRVQDPLFGKHPEHRYASLRQQISRDAHDADRPAAGTP
jgi:hemerythrin-like domain-containing protein